MKKKRTYQDAPSRDTGAIYEPEPGLALELAPDMAGTVRSSVLKDFRSIYALAPELILEYAPDMVSHRENIISQVDEPYRTEPPLPSKRVSSPRVSSPRVSSPREEPIEVTIAPEVVAELRGLVERLWAEREGKRRG